MVQGCTGSRVYGVLGYVMFLDGAWGRERLGHGEVLERHSSHMSFQSAPFIGSLARCCMSRFVSRLQTLPTTGLL